MRNSDAVEFCTRGRASPTYWILDLERRVLVAFRWPENDGWAVRDEFAETERVAPLSSPDNLVLVSELLPPLTESHS